MSELPTSGSRTYSWAERLREAADRPIPDRMDATDVAELPPLEEAAPQRDPLEEVSATGVRRARRRRSAVRNAVEWVVVLAGALVVALVVKTFLFQAFYIPSGSMEPTLHIGDRVLVNKFNYDLGDVDRGDIIVFERPATWATGDIEDLIKRVIGLPGDTVAVRDGVVYINGEPLPEPYLPPEVITPDFYDSSGCVPECTLGPDQLFVLGDNREHSLASNAQGPIHFDDVVGLAFIRVWPLGDFGGL